MNYTLRKTTTQNQVIATLFVIELLLYFIVPISTIMKLMMFVGNDLIESVTINPTDLRVPGYLGKFKRSLKSKYAELIKMATQEPEFLVSERELQQAPVEQKQPLPAYQRIFRQTR